LLCSSFFFFGKIKRDKIRYHNFRKLCVIIKIKHAKNCWEELEKFKVSDGFVVFTKIQFLLHLIKWKKNVMESQITRFSGTYSYIHIEILWYLLIKVRKATINQITTFYVTAKLGLFFNPSRSQLEFLKNYSFCLDLIYFVKFQLCGLILQMLIL
jgi:hypothetical protein